MRGPKETPATTSHVKRKAVPHRDDESVPKRHRLPVPQTPNLEQIVRHDRPRDNPRNAATPIVSGPPMFNFDPRPGSRPGRRASRGQGARQREKRRQEMSFATGVDSPAGDDADRERQRLLRVARDAAIWAERHIADKERGEDAMDWKH